MPRPSIIRSLAGGAVLAPLLAFGHASEFVMAHLGVLHDGVVELQMIADYAGNPLLPDEAAAEVALRDLLQLCGPNATVRLGDLAPLHFTKTTEWPADTPASIAPPLDGQAHELLMATWRWRPDSREIVFKVPHGSRHDVLMWTHGTEKTPESARWLMLIAGDQTPPIKIPAPEAGTPWLLITGFVLLGVVALLQVRRGKRRAKEMRKRR